MQTKAAKTTVTTDSQHAPHHPAPEKRRPYSAHEPDYRAIRRPERLTAKTVIALQRAGGNQAVSRLMEKRAIQRKQAAGEAVQRQSAEEEEPLQGKFAALQRVSEEEEPLQGKFAALQRVSQEEEEPLQGKFAALQRVSQEEEEPLQGKFAALQRVSEEEEEPLQGKFSAETGPALQKKGGPASNLTGLPDGLKAGVEQLSGLSLDDVRVHYNSSKPADVQALAYTQGTDIHVAPGQERNLPHEAWHVVQQMQGRVEPTLQMKDDIPINDDQRLEQEADDMGKKALASAERQPEPAGEDSPRETAPIADAVVQRVSYVKQTDYTVSETRALLNQSEGRESPVTHQPGHPRQHVGRWEKVMAVAEEQGKTKSAFTNTGEQDQAINSALNSQRAALSAQLDAAASAHTPTRVQLEKVATEAAQVLVFKAKKKKGKGGAVKSWVASHGIAEKATVIVESMGDGVDGAIHIQTAYPVVD